MCTHRSYGYALEECKERGLAEEVARRALAINKTTPFATHAMGELFVVVDSLRLNQNYVTDKIYIVATCRTRSV